MSERSCQRELREIRNSLEFQRDVLTPNVNKARGMLSKIPTSGLQGENLEVLNNDIGALISIINREVMEIDSPDTTLYKDVTQVLSDLQIAYKKQLDLGESSAGQGEIRSELQLCKTEVRQLENEVKDLKANASKGNDCSQYVKRLGEAENLLSQSELENRALKNEIAKLRNQ
ncbi:unnamed protein product [marine sediment metagenome]|uniref:Uncharacterized protein n=1 Tax=marine sediment metagenome TaxID=412755 RepID=X0ZK17_9ZZZZ